MEKARGRGWGKKAAGRGKASKGTDMFATTRPTRHRPPCRIQAGQPIPEKLCLRRPELVRPLTSALAPRLDACQAIMYLSITPAVILQCQRGADFVSVAVSQHICHSRSNPPCERNLFRPA